MKQPTSESPIVDSSRPRKRSKWIIGLLIGFAFILGLWFCFSERHDPRLVGTWRQFNDEGRFENFQWEFRPDGTGILTIYEPPGQQPLGIHWWTTSGDRLRFTFDRPNRLQVLKDKLRTWRQFLSGQEPDGFVTLSASPRLVMLRVSGLKQVVQFRRVTEAWQPPIFTLDDSPRMPPLMAPIIPR